MATVSVIPPNLNVRGHVLHHLGIICMTGQEKAFLTGWTDFNSQNPAFIHHSVA